MDEQCVRRPGFRFGRIAPPDPARLYCVFPPRFGTLATLRQFEDVEAIQGKPSTTKALTSWSLPPAPKLVKRKYEPDERLEAFTERLQELYEALFDEGGKDLAGLAILHLSQASSITIADLQKLKAPALSFLPLSGRLLPLLYISEPTSESISWTHSLCQSLSFRHHFTVNR
jgi:hypothetical protein